MKKYLTCSNEFESLYPHIIKDYEREEKSRKIDLSPQDPKTFTKQQLKYREWLKQKYLNNDKNK